LEESVHRPTLDTKSKWCRPPPELSLISSIEEFTIAPSKPDIVIFDWSQASKCTFKRRVTVMVLREQGNGEDWPATDDKKAGAITTSAPSSGVEIETHVVSAEMLTEIGPNADAGFCTLKPKLYSVPIWILFPGPTVSTRLPDTSWPIPSDELTLDLNSRAVEAFSENRLGRKGWMNLPLIITSRSVDDWRGEKNTLLHWLPRYPMAIPMYVPLSEAHSRAVAEAVSQDLFASFDTDATKTSLGVEMKLAQ